MFRKPTQNRPGFITVGAGTINKKLVDGPDEEVLEQKSVEPAYKVQPYGSSTKLFTNAYRVKPTGDVKLGEPLVSFRPPESESLAWKRAEDENRRVQKTVDAIFRAEKVSDFVNRIYTPKPVEVSGLQGVMDSNSDTIRAAIDVINNTGAASKPLNYPPTQMQPTGQPPGQPTGQVPSGKPAGQPPGQQPAQIPSVQPAVRVPSSQPAVIPSPPTSSGLSILDEILSAGYGVYGFFLNDSFAVGPVVMYKPNVVPPVSIGVLPSIIGPVLVNGQGAAPYYFGTLRDIGARRLVGWNEGAGLRAVSTIPLPGAQPITKSINVHLTYQSLTYSTTLMPFIPSGQPAGQPAGQPPSGQPTGQPPGQQPAQIPSVQPAVRVPSSQPAVIPRPPTSSGLSILDEILSAGYGVYGFFLNDAFAVGPVVMYEPDVGPPVSIGVLPSIIGPVLVNGQGAAPYYFGTLRDIGARRLVGWNEGAGLRAVSTMPLPGAQPITKSINVHLTYQSLTYSTTLVPFIPGRAPPSPPFVAPPTLPTTGTITPAPTSGDTRISTPSNVPGAQTSGAVTSGVDALRSILESGTAVNAFILNNSTAYGPVLLYKGPTVPQNVAVLADPIGPVLISGQGASPGGTPYYITTHQDIGNRQITPWVAPPTSVQTTTFPVSGALPLLAPFDISVMAGRKSYDITLTPAQSTALVTTSTALVLTSSRRSVIPPLTDDQLYTEFFVNRYNPVPYGTMTVPDLSADPQTVDTVNAILFDGTNKQLATSITYLSGVMGIYPALMRTNWAGTELYSLVLHDLKFILNWDDESINGLGQIYTATFAYDALRDYVTGVPDPGGGAGLMGWYGKAGGTNARAREMHAELSNRIESVTDSALQSMLYVIGHLFSDNFYITAWTVHPFTSREDMGIITLPGLYPGDTREWMNHGANDRAYYLKAFLWTLNKGWMDVKKEVDLLAFALEPTVSGLNLGVGPKVEGVPRKSVFKDWTQWMAKKWFTAQFSSALGSSLYSAFQKGSLMSYIAGGSLVASLGGLGALLAMSYGAYGWGEALTGLLALSVAIFKAFRAKGRVVMADLRTAELMNRIRELQGPLMQNVNQATDLPIQKSELVSMFKEAFARYLGTAVQTAVQTTVQSIVDNAALSSILYGLGNKAITIGKANAVLKNSFQATLTALGVPRANVDTVISDMTSGSGRFSFYAADDTVSDVLYNALDANQNAIKARLANYLAYKSKLVPTNPPLTEAEEAMRQFTQHFGENRKPGSVFLRMTVEDRTRWSILFSVLFGLTPEQVAKVWALQTFEDEPAIEPETITDVDAFRNAMATFFNPENSLRKITISAMPFNYKWFAVKRRRAIFKTNWEIIFRAMGAAPEDVSAVIGSLDPYKPGMSKYDTENRSGIRTNGAHGIRPGFNEFLERNMAVFSKFMSAFSSDDRVRFAKVFFMRFFGLRGFRPLVDKVFALTPAEYTKASPTRVEQIDVLEMDASHLDGDKPDIPEPTDAEIAGYGVPWPLPESRGSKP
jgi:hypothetical protein